MSKFGDNTPLFECPECGDPTVVSTEATGVIELDCPSCGHPTLTHVDDLCRIGRTLDPYQPACYREWDVKWETPNLIVRLCEEHCQEKAPENK